MVIPQALFFLHRIVFGLLWFCVSSPVLKEMHHSIFILFCIFVKQAMSFLLGVGLLFEIFIYLETGPHTFQIRLKFSIYQS